MNIYGQYSEAVGVPVTVRDGVGAAARAHRISDPHVVTDLERTYRGGVNEMLAGTGLALVGNKIIGPDTFTPDQVRAQTRLEEAAGTPDAASAGLGRGRTGSARLRGSCLGAGTEHDAFGGPGRRARVLIRAWR